MMPAIYFIFSRRGCREALSRCSVRGISLTKPEERHAIDIEWKRTLEGFTDSDEREVFIDSLDETTLVRGIAMHHAGMLPAAKELVEHLFQRGLIKVVFATETLSLGLNMPARACVVSSFSKFDGQEFALLSGGEVTQLMGRAGRRGIDTQGHGIILKEPGVDIRDIYEACVADEMAVTSKFSPTYTMILGLLRTRTIAMAELLVDRSFGQFQRLGADLHWDQREQNLRLRYDDLKRNHYHHPHLPCSEKTLSSHLRMLSELEHAGAEMKTLKREHWRGNRAGRRTGRSDPGQKFDVVKRKLNQVEKRIANSPCTHCPFFNDHRAQRHEILDIEDLLENGQTEVRDVRDQYRREFRALCEVLRAAGYLDGETPTELGRVAGSLYGESSLLVADAVTSGHWAGLKPAELAATVSILVGEDRGRDRRNRPAFPSASVERAARRMRSTMLELSDHERRFGIYSNRTMSFDYMASSFQWVSGVPLVDIDAPPSADIGDVIKTMKNVYSMLRQLEHVTVGRDVHALVTATRRAMERDLIRRL
jgi:ATP-dependent RNA helicase HelY